MPLFAPSTRSASSSDTEPLDGACGFSESLIAPRHRLMLNAIWADGHVRVVKARSAGSTCTSLDGRSTDPALVTSEGPYAGLRTLGGIPVMNADDTWGLRRGGRGIMKGAGGGLRGVGDASAGQGAM